MNRVPIRAWASWGRQVAARPVPKDVEGSRPRKEHSCGGTDAPKLGPRCLGLAPRKSGSSRGALRTLTGPGKRASPVRGQLPDPDRKAPSRTNENSTTMYS